MTLDKKKKKTELINIEEVHGQKGNLFTESTRPRIFQRLLPSNLTEKIGCLLYTSDAADEVCRV